MLHAREDVAYIYVFAGVIPALTIIISAVAGNSVTIREPPKGIVSKTAYATLVLAVTQARNNFVDPITAWEELATPKKKKKSSTTTDGGLASNGANKGDKSGSRHIIGGEEDIKERKTCEAKARSKNNKIKE
jgi:ABC-type Fe3+-hydroxamate transport system substrate-binding protein